MWQHLLEESPDGDPDILCKEDLRGEQPPSLRSSSFHRVSESLCYNRTMRECIQDAEPVTESSYTPKKQTAWGWGLSLVILKYTYGQFMRCSKLVWVEQGWLQAITPDRRSVLRSSDPPRSNSLRQVNLLVCHMQPAAATGFTARMSRVFVLMRQYI